MTFIILHFTICSFHLISPSFFSVRIWLEMQSKTPSLWLCYMKTHWKMFVCGGILKLLGDLTALVGPISITKIVEYIDIQINLNATPSSSLLSSVVGVSSPESAINTEAPATSALKSFMFSDRIDAIASEAMANSTTKIGSNNNYYLPSATAEAYKASTLLINENTEIYYPTWSEFVANGWIMALLVLFASLAQGTFSQASSHMVNVIGIHLRTSLQSLVYRKSLLISSSCFTESIGDIDNLSATSMPNGNNNNNNNSTDCGENSNASISANDPEACNRFVNNESVMNGIDDDDHNKADDVGNNSSQSDGACVDEVDKMKTEPSDTVDGAAQQEQQQQQHQQEKQSPKEQTVIDTGTITNLMSEDALNVMSFFWIAHYVWAIPLKVCFTLYFATLLLRIFQSLAKWTCTFGLSKPQAVYAFSSCFLVSFN